MAPRTLLVVDAETLFYDPLFLARTDADVLLSLSVLDEVAAAALREGSRGRAARLFLKELDRLVERPGEGAALPGGGRLTLAQGGAAGMHAELLRLTRESGASLVTRDPLLRIKAELCSVRAVRYLPYRGIAPLRLSPSRHVVSEAELALFLREGRIPAPVQLSPNQHLLLVSPSSWSVLAPGRFNAATEMLVSLRYLPAAGAGFSARDAVQRCALDLLLDPSIGKVLVAGGNRSGKLILSVASGLLQVRERRYRRVRILAAGQGEAGLLRERFRGERPGRDAAAPPAGGCREAANDPCGHLPETLSVGRFLPGRGPCCGEFIVVSGVQDLTLHEAEEALELAGEGSKLVLVGDPSRIGNHRLCGGDNGMVSTWGLLRGRGDAGGIVLGGTEPAEAPL